jgi:hypothetical protein
MFLERKYSTLGQFIPELLKLSSVAEPHHFEAAPAPIEIFVATPTSLAPMALLRL